MMKTSRFEKDKKKFKKKNNRIKDTRNLFRIKKEINDDTTIKDMRYLFRLEKEIGNTTIKDIRNFLDWKKK